jgi:hypothetical protein
MLSAAIRAGPEKRATEHAEWKEITTMSVDLAHESRPVAEAAPTAIVAQFSRSGHDWQEKPKRMRDSISGIVIWDGTLWVASDQTATVERLAADDANLPTTYDNHRSFRLADFVPLPHRSSAKPDQEVDLEGIDVQRLGASAGYLWLVGSHSHARDKVDEDKSVEDGIESLADISLDDNRCALIRIPITQRGGRLPELVANCPDPRHPGRTLTAGMLSTLLTTIAADEHFRSFFTIHDNAVQTAVPGKDNGLDIEGLAVHDDRVFLGLRGPVLRGWAVILQLEIDERTTDNGATELRLRPTAQGAAYRKYFLQLGGLGVRELFADGDDLLVLAGPTMDLDGPVRIHRWINGATGTGRELVPAERLPVVTELRTGTVQPGKDHPEGFTRLQTTAGARLLVAYDSPAGSRTAIDGAVLIDSLPWP